MKIILSRDKLVNWFINNEYELYVEMRKSEHTVDLKSSNPFHIENEVFTHTLMVMTWIEANKDRYSDEDYIVLITSALLHDTGKPQCQEKIPASDTKPERYAFKGHEGVSTFISISVLKKLQKDFPEIYTKEIIEKIIKIVSLHGTYIEETSDIKFIREEFHKADKNGAVRIVDETIFSQYSPRKFLKNKILNDKKLTLLIGLPCSGKSTLKNKILNENPDIFIISRDDLLEAYYKELFGEVGTYNEIYNTIHSNEELLKQFTTLFNELLKEATKYHDVLIDMTQLSLSTRRKMLNNFQNFKKNAFVIMTDNNELYRRNKERFEKENKLIKDNVLFNMMRSFVYPIYEEGFENITLEIN